MRRGALLRSAHEIGDACGDELLWVMDKLCGGGLLWVMDKLCGGGLLYYRLITACLLSS